MSKAANCPPCQTINVKCDTNGSSNLFPRPPQLKGLHASQTKRNLITSMALAGVGMVMFYYMVAKPRRQKYADFYANYDAEASCERMEKAGLFQSGENWKG